MSAYISLYRKWRPRVFGDVIGQDHVTTTLKNSILAGKVSHAFLFSGPRGTGKTTVAKILANALNCQNSKDGEPCNECDICMSAINGSNPDVLEIDAASNRGIDEIREIKEKAYFSTVRGRYKVYIVDEVHMLTTEAFNALLKILEEPPAHVIFVLATTDVHKVPQTIVSRCQRHDFKRITITDIVGRLKTVAEAEGITVNEGALSMVASHVRGSLRDALGLLEQLTSFAADEITEQDVVKLLDATDIGVLFELTGLIKDKNTAEAVFMIEKIARGGRDLQQFIRDWQTHLRDLFLILNVTRDTAEKLINTSPETFGLFHSQAQSFTSHEILHFIELLSSAARDIKSGTQPRLSTELAILKMTREQADLSLDGVLFRLKVLEDRLVKLEKGGLRPAAAGSGKAGEAGGVGAAADVTMAASEESETTEEPARILDIEEFKKLWPVVMDRLRTKRINLYALLLEARPSGMEGDTVTLKLAPTAKFHKKEIEKDANRSMIEEAIRDMTGAKLKIKCEAEEKPPEEKEPEKPLGLTSTEKENMDSGDILDMLKKDLGAEVIEEIKLSDNEK